MTRPEMRRERARLAPLAAAAVQSFLLMMVPAAAHAASTSIYAPANGGVVLGRQVVLDVRGCVQSPGDLRVLFDDHLVRPVWMPGPYSGQWVAHFDFKTEGGHQLELVGRCKARTEFVSISTGAGEVAWSVARNFIHKNNVAQLPWDWGPAIFLYGLSKLDPNAPWIAQYQDYWAGQGVSMPDHADTCAPGLTALQLMRVNDNYTALTSVQAVANYLTLAPRNALGAINHLGTWFWSFLYPPSIWVDSLEMTAIFAAQWGRFAGDQALLDFGAAQPGIYASVLQDPATGLFHHAYDLKKNVTIPSDATFWLRGNGWAAASIVDILDELPPDHPKRAQLLSILTTLVNGLLVYQQETGFWDSIANLPGQTYGETSGTALVAYAIAKGVHRGWLPATLMPAAKAAFTAVTARLLPVGHEWIAGGPGHLFRLPLRLSMPRISGATDPGPRWLYELVPAVSDAPYGVGAYLMAAAELREENF